MTGVAVDVVVTGAIVEGGSGVVRSTKTGDKEVAIVEVEGSFTVEVEWKVISTGKNCSVVVEDGPSLVTGDSVVDGEARSVE